MATLMVEFDKNILPNHNCFRYAAFFSAYILADKRNGTIQFNIRLIAFHFLFFYINSFVRFFIILMPEKKLKLK